MTASLLWRWLVEVLAGLSFKAAAEKLRLPFALETVYRLRRGLRQCLASVRTRLCREQSPPVRAQADPLLQTVEHLRAVFPTAVVPRPIFNSIFSVRFWVERGQESFLAELPPPFAAGGFGLRATTRQSSAGSRAFVGSVAGMNKKPSAHRPTAGTGN